MNEEHRMRISDVAGAVTSLLHDVERSILVGAVNGGMSSEAIRHSIFKLNDAAKRIEMFPHYRYEIVPVRQRDGIGQGWFPCRKHSAERFEIYDMIEPAEPVLVSNAASEELATKWIAKRG